MFYKTGVFCQKKTLVQKEEEEYKNYVKMLWLITKSAYVIYEWSPRKQPTPLSRQQATVGPCLAELDPAVAQASQHRLQNMSDQDFSNFTNLLSPFR